MIFKGGSKDEDSMSTHSMGDIQCNISNDNSIETKDDPEKNDETSDQALCPVCGFELGDTYLTVADKEYHVECFKCSICDKLIDGIFFNDDDGNILCPEDFKVSRAVHYFFQ